MSTTNSFLVCNDAHADVMQKPHLVVSIQILVYNLNILYELKLRNQIATISNELRLIFSIN